MASSPNEQRIIIRFLAKTELIKGSKPLSPILARLQLLSEVF